MIWTEQIERQAHHLAEILTEDQWNLLRDIAVLMANPIKLKTSQEAEKEELAKRRNAVISIREWRKEMIGDFIRPARWDLGSMDLVELIQRMAPTGIADRNLIWDGLAVMYDYGFKRGMAYQKRTGAKQAKKEAKP